MRYLLFTMTALIAIILSSTISDAAYGKTKWEIMEISQDHQTFKILYNINNVSISRLTVQPESYSLVIYLTEIKEDARLDITIPRELVAGISLSDDLFILLDGKEIESFEEMDSSQCFRTLSIHLPPKRSGEESILEIIGFSPSQMPTFEKIPQISITTEWNEQSKEAIISGCTSLTLNDEEVTIRISDQDGVTYKTLSVTPDENGSFFMAVPSVNEQLADGTYTISAEYDDQHASSVLVVPEFHYESSKYLKITEVELDPLPTDELGQWIEVHNPTNDIISSSIAVVQQDQEFPQFVTTFTSIEPDEYIVFEIWSKGAPKDEGFLVENSVLILLGDGNEMDRTPPLTDTFSDSRTWQLNGTDWVFAEETPMRAIPEFPYFISFIFLVSMVATLLFTKTKKSKWM